MRAKIGYQIFPDRFLSSSAKPDTLPWDAPVRRHERQEYDFYGGDLEGVRSKINYVKELGAEFIYLTPVFKAATNHRYDCTDYFAIDELLGNEEDLRKLCGSAHENGMEVTLDGVFNHVGKNHPWFKDALDGGPSAEFFRKEGSGFVRWWNADNLPELNLENEKLRKLLWGTENSVISKWTEIGADQWRLDCAFDLGYEYCREITANVKKLGGKKVIGEIWSYPKEWITGDVLDGIMNYHFTSVIQKYLSGRINGDLASRLLSETIEDCTAERLLPSWNVVSSHDTPRVRHAFGDLWKLAVVLQFTLPGSPVIYYGEELGMTGGGDPLCREPMKWDLATEGNEDLAFYKGMTRLFRESAALSSGEYEPVVCDNPKVLAFVRKTDKVRETKLVVVNPSETDEEFEIFTKDSSLMNHTYLTDHFGENSLLVRCSGASGRVPAKSFGIFGPKIEGTGYTPYKRIP